MVLAVALLAVVAAIVLSRSIEQLATMFVPLYLWRAATFMADAAFEDDSTVQARLDSLCETFQRLKPVLVSSWSAK